jgi:hypothetical protein
LKYRKLDLKELEALREDFVQFLSANSIPADDWVKLKETDREAAEKMIEVFSDIVWEKVLSKISYVKLVSKTILRVMYFGKEKAEMIQLKVEKDGFSFAAPDLIRGIAEGSLDLAQYDPEMITGTKTYSKPRGYEVFLAMEQGAQPTDELFWAALQSMLPKKEGPNVSDE